MKGETILMRRAPAPIGAPFPHHLSPSDDRACEQLKRIPIGEDFAVKIMRGRNLQHHRKFWAELSFAAEASKYETPEKLLAALKIALGWFDRVLQLKTNREIAVPRSISFAEMDQTEFARFYDQAINLICADVMGGMDRDQFHAEAQAAHGLRP